MPQQPIDRSPAETWENEGGGLTASTRAEALGVTRFLAESYVVGGYSFTNLADAVAQARRMRARDAGS